MYISFKFLKNFFEYFTKSPYDNGHLHPIIHITVTAGEISRVASKTEVPQGEQRQLQNMLRTLKSNTKKQTKKSYHKIVPE